MLVTTYLVRLLWLLNLQDYTATIFLRQRWTDERLVFQGNKSLSLDGRLVELLWVPDTFIVDSKKSFLHDITVENRLIRIFPNGTVLYALRWEISWQFNFIITAPNVGQVTGSLAWSWECGLNFYKECVLSKTVVLGLNLEHECDLSACGLLNQRFA